MILLPFFHAGSVDVVYPRGNSVFGLDEGSHVKGGGLRGEG